MDLKEHDLHLTYSEVGKRLKVYASDHRLLMECEARNSTVNNGTYGHWGNCPFGSFLLGHPVAKHEPAFGFWFIGVHDYDHHTALHDWGRGGIGIHGGGSGLGDPYAGHQGWVITHGCLRLPNADLEILVGHVKAAQAAGGRCFLTVSA